MKHDGRNAVRAIKHYLIAMPRNQRGPFRLKTCGISRHRLCENRVLSDRYQRCPSLYDMSLLLSGMVVCVQNGACEEIVQPHVCLR